MHLLYDTEITQLAKQAEELIIHQNDIRSCVKHWKAEHLLIPENSIDIAKYLLKKKHHLPGDIERLEKQIEINIKNYNWYNNLL